MSGDGRSNQADKGTGVETGRSGTKAAAGSEHLGAGAADVRVKPPGKPPPETPEGSHVHGGGQPPGQEPWLAWAALGLLILATLVGLRASLEWEAAEESADIGPPPVQAETVDDVRVWGRADRSRVGREEELTLWLFVQNRSGKPISGLRIDELDAPGMTHTGTCWPEPCKLPQCAPVCRFGETSARGLKDELQPGESTGVYGRLKLDGLLKPGAHLSASFSWTSAPAPDATSVRSRPATAVVGPFFAATAQRWWIVLPRSLYEVLKDLGLPIVLAVLAFVFKRIQSDRERARKRDEDEKERRRQDAAAEEARRHETYQSLLPRAHENAVRFVLPMCVNAGQAAQEIGKARAAAWAERETTARTVGAGTAGVASSAKRAAEEASSAKRIAQRRAFYYFVLLLKRNFHLVEKGGGYFFESLAGEFMVYDCWNGLFDRAVRQLGYASLYALLDRVDANDSLLQFESRFCFLGYSGVEGETHGPGPAFSETFTRIRGRFEAWIDTPTAPGNPAPRSDIELLLDLFSKLTQYEINRLYRLWYREPDKGDEEALSGLSAELEPWAHRNDPADAALKKLHADLATRFPPRVGPAATSQGGASTEAGVP